MNGSGEFGILDKQIDVLRTGGILPEKDILSLCTKVGCVGAHESVVAAVLGELLSILFLVACFREPGAP